VRIGSPAMTTRGFGLAEAEKVANLIADVLDAPADDAATANVRRQVEILCKAHPVYEPLPATAKVPA
jgi:glycine hydroxymethyltransferase